MRKKLSERQLYERTVTEKDIVGAMRQLLELNGAYVDIIVERIPWGKTTSEGGIPDMAGRFPKGCRTLKDSIFEPFNQVMAVSFWIEAKRPNGKLRASQAIWLDRAKQDGVICFKADSVEAMVAGFREFGIEIKGLPSKESR